LVVVAAAVLGIAAFAVMVAKDRTYVASVPFSPQGEPNREIAVVYYSRSGHSEAAAREIARTFNAPIARIDADYPRDFSGQGKALSDARAEAHPQIRVEPIDLAPTRRVFLVSPTWLFRPAPPLWTYVEQADLRGKEVVLVMTGNSRYKQEEIDEFGRRVAKHWLRSNPVADVEGVGKRRHGKAQLRIDEARRWMAKAIELADGGEGGAIAAMMALLLGMRASEIVSRVVRDLDDDGHLLWIPTAKTEAGKRTLRVPDVLRPYLQRLAADSTPHAPLFGQHWRDWPREWVQRVCELAGVPKVTAHGMRGLHSTLAMEAGITGHVVAASLGHENVSTTVQSYAKPEAVAGAQQRRALRVLAGGAG